MPVIVNATARPVAAVKACSSKAPRVFSRQQKLAIAGAAASFATAVAPAAQAAQEIAMNAEGEAAIIQLGWGAVAASFSLSLAFVVWGRSGL